MIQANQTILWELSTPLLERIHKCVSIFYRNTVETSWCFFVMGFDLAKYNFAKEIINGGEVILENN